MANYFLFSPPAFKALPQTSTVQLRNRTTGAEMILSKKCNANDRLPASPNNRRQSSRSVGLAGRANSSDVKPDQRRAVRLTFFEDFTLEHSLHGVQITSTEIAGIF